MLVYLKENGFPMSIWIETMSVENHCKNCNKLGSEYCAQSCEEREKEQWEGYESVVTDEDDNIIAEITHDSLRGRVMWAEGFFKGLKMQQIKDK